MAKRSNTTDQKQDTTDRLNSSSRLWKVKITRIVRSSYADAVKTLEVTLAANRSLETGQIESIVV